MNFFDGENLVPAAERFTRPRVDAREVGAHALAQFTDHRHPLTTDERNDVLRDMLRSNVALTAEQRVTIQRALGGEL